MAASTRPAKVRRSRRRTVPSAKWGEGTADPSRSESGRVTGPRVPGWWVAAAVVAVAAASAACSGATTACKWW